MASNFKVIAYVLALAIALAKFIDFLLGKNRRAKLKERLIFPPWYAMQELDLIKPIMDGSKSFCNGVLHTVGWFNRGGMVIYGVFVSSVTSLIGSYIKPPSSTWDDGLESDKLDFMLVGGVACFSFLFTWLSATLLSEKKKTSQGLIVWLGNTTFVIIVLCLIAAHYRTSSRFESGFSTPVNFPGGFDFPFGVILYAPGIMLPVVMHSLFMFYFFGLLAGEYVRRFVVVLIERIDESNSSPVSLLAAFIGGLIALVDITIKTFWK